HTFTIVGVAARDFTGITAIQGTDLFLPLSMTAEAIPRLTPGILQNRNSKWLRVFGRLKDGATAKQANTEVATLGAALVRAYPEANEGALSVFGGFGLDPDERSDFKSFLGILQVAVLLLLLMACCNVANLLLVRASLRQREIAIRLSLGAGRRQVIRQLLVEGLLLSFLGGLLGLLVAPWGSDFVLAFEQPTRGFRHIPVKVDLNVVVFTFGIVVLTGLIFGLAPAFQTRRPDLVTALKSAGLRGGLRRSHAQKALVVSQVSISLVLLIGAGLAVRTMRKIVAVNTGFNSNNLLLMSFDLIVQGYGPERGQSFYRDLLDSAQKIPGVKSASLATVIPPAGDNVWLGHLFYPGQEPNQKEFAANWDAGLEVDVDAIGPNYFETIGTPLIAGREFNAGDDQHSPLVAVVNQKLAERLWPGGNPIGKRIVRPSSEGVILPP
ncbi:MAG: FtsX-like permease family protein, partial [Blastocatellia bacterium]